MTELTDRAKSAFAIYSGLGKNIINEMIAEIERLERHIEELSMKVKGEDCGCSYDGPGEVCMTHSPTVERLKRELAEAKELIKNTSTNLDKATYNKALEEAAKAIENYRDIDAIAADIKIGNFPQRRKLSVQLAEAIRARIKP